MSKRVSVIALAASFALTACGSPGNGNPLPHPSATPAQTPADYFPVNNTASFAVAISSGYGLGYDLTGVALGIRSNYGASCDSSPGVTGDYVGYAPLLVPDVEEFTPTASGALIQVYTNVIVTKNLSNDLIVDGYALPGSVIYPSGNTCVTPYVLMPSNAKAGDTWAFTDIAGRKITASVVFDHRPKTYSANNAVQAYPSVTEVNYGADYTIDWAAGYGPVQIVEHTIPAPQEPVSYTAFNFAVGI